MQFKGIKQQTLALLVSLTLGLALVFSLLAVVTAFIVEDKILSNLLDEQAAHIEQHYRHQGKLPALSSGFLQIFTHLDEVPDWAEERVARPQLHGEIFTPDGTHYHYRKLTLTKESGETLLTGVLFAEVSRLLAVTHQPGIFLWFLLVFVLAITLAIFLAVKFSRRIVNPVLTLAKAVKLNEAQIGKSPVPARSYELPKLDYELGYLSDTLQSSLTQLNLLLEREKSFATNVSHELRTPLTVLKNSCALISQRGFTDEDFIEIKTSCKRMEHIVDVLLALARAESIELQSCKARLALEQAILDCDTLPSKNFQVELTVPDNLTVIANPRLLDLLFFNLLRNAAEHASEPELTISAAGNKLIFENSLTSQPVIDVTQAGTKGTYSQGIGQGLFLVARIVERFRWQLEVETSSEHFRIIIFFG